MLAPAYTHLGALGSSLEQFTTSHKHIFSPQTVLFAHWYYRACKISGLSLSKAVPDPNKTQQVMFCVAGRGRLFAYNLLGEMVRICWIVKVAAVPVGMAAPQSYGIVGTTYAILQTPATTYFTCIHTHTGLSGF